MTDIMKLADDYAEKADAWNRGELNPQVVDKYRAALQSAIEALQAENERLNRLYSKEHKMRDDLRSQVDSLNDGFNNCQKERDALQAKLDATHAVLDSDDSKIVRNAADGYPEGREPRELTLSERVEALCTYATDWKRWCEEVQAKLDELQRQEPVGRFVSDDDCGHIDLVPHQGQPMVDGQAVYAAPKALEPLTRDAVKVICSEAGYTRASAQEKADFINGLRHGEKAHGITKGTP